MKVRAGQPTRPWLKIPNAFAHQDFVVPGGLRPELEDACKVVLERGWENIDWPNDFTALHLAARLGSKAATVYLLRAGAEVSLRVRDSKGRLPTDCARERGHTFLESYLDSATANATLVEFEDRQADNSDLPLTSQTDSLQCMPQIMSKEAANATTTADEDAVAKTHGNVDVDTNNAVDHTAADADWPWDPVGFVMETLANVVTPRDVVAQSGTTSADATMAAADQELVAFREERSAAVAATARSLARQALAAFDADMCQRPKTCRSCDYMRLVLLSSDTPDKVDFRNMIKTFYLEYDFQTADLPIFHAMVEQAILKARAELGDAWNGRFESIALACHGPPGEVAGKFSAWKISERLVIHDHNELLDPTNHARQFLVDLGKAVVDREGAANDGRVDLFACSLLDSAEGREIFATIESECSTNFAASTNLTGNPKYGGDWIMESDNVDVRDTYFCSTDAFDGTFEMHAAAIVKPANEAETAKSARAAEVADSELTGGSEGRPTKTLRPAGSAAVGAVVLGATGGAVGGATGTIAGAVVGVPAAFLTFGLAIPVCATVGGTIGLCMGAGAGAVSGGVVGGSIGYLRTIRAMSQAQEIASEPYDHQLEQQYVPLLALEAQAQAPSGAVIFGRRSDA